MDTIASGPADNLSDIEDVLSVVVDGTDVVVRATSPSDEDPVEVRCPLVRLRGLLAAIDAVCAGDADHVEVDETVFVERASLAPSHIWVGDRRPRPAPPRSPSWVARMPTHVVALPEQWRPLVDETRAWGRDHDWRSPQARRLDPTTQTPLAVSLHHPRSTTTV